MIEYGEASRRCGLLGCRWVIPMSVAREPIPSEVRVCARPGCRRVRDWRTYDDEPSQPQALMVNVIGEWGEPIGVTYTRT